MKKIVAVSAILSLVLGAIPASADNAGRDHGSRASTAKTLQWRMTFLPRRYQTANVFDASAGPGVRLGAASLIRSKNGIEGRIMTNVATAGDPYTLWLVVFNNPDACVDGCDASDLAIPEVRGSVYNGSGAISAANGYGGGVINIDFSMVAGNIANDQFVLVGDPKGLKRGRGLKAEVHLVVDQHPQIMQGPDSWIADLTTTNFPGTGPAFSVAVAVFVACPDSSCPASVL